MIHEDSTDQGRDKGAYQTAMNLLMIFPYYSYNLFLGD